MFGPHLIIDGSRCDTRKLADRILVEQILGDYPAAIGMTKIGGPYMFEYQAPDPAYSGVSGLVVIAESHIAIHTFPELDYFTMDIFSCKNFDHEKAIAYIKEAFDVQEMDRMLVQRGLSFRGPHHGKHGATDELIAAADARLAAGIISKETALTEESADEVALHSEREVAVRRAGAAGELAPSGIAGSGRMLWPVYGQTPDLGSYGPLSAPAGGDMVGEVAHTRQLRGAAGAHSAIEPTLVNPTTSISGLLDKLSVMSGTGRAMGRSLDNWERLARDPECLIALTISTPVIPAGLRELLVFTVERGFVNVVVACADDLYADCYQALGFEHARDGEANVASAEGRQATWEFLQAFYRDPRPGEIVTASDLWEALGRALPARAPRKGLLQAAAAAGVRIFTPDLASSLFGASLLAARAGGFALTLDAAEDALQLGKLMARAPRVGVIHVGAGTAHALFEQSLELLPLVGLTAPALTGAVAVDGAGGNVEGERTVALACDVTLALPLLVTGLAQRIPGMRHSMLSASWERAERETAALA